jgi:hypothetical protein
LCGVYLPVLCQYFMHVTHCPNLEAPTGNFQLYIIQICICNHFAPLLLNRCV